jgi:mono/diheme cytochrome c family protein
VNLSTVLIVVCSLPLLAGAQECGGGACGSGVQAGACGQAAAPMTVDAALATKLAAGARRAECSTIARRDFMTWLPFAATQDKAEGLVALVREAPDLAAASRIILDAAAQAHAPATKFAAGLPAKLSETGFYASLEQNRLHDIFTPYDVNVPLWSDDAKKERFIALPAGAKATFKRDGEWVMPTLYLEDAGARRFTETRVIVKEADGLRFASYAWDEDQRNATLRPAGDEFYANVGHTSQLWRIESADSCARCHNDVSGKTLGFNTLQLNRGAGDKNQLALLAARGVVDGLPETLSALPALASPTDLAQPLEARVRSYLHTNCSTCHQPGGPGSGTLDLRLETPLAQTGLLRSRVVAGRGGVVSPGRPQRSKLVRRMASVDWDRMPSLLSTVPDESGIAMISTWISSLTPAGVQATLAASPQILSTEKSKVCGETMSAGCGDAKEECAPAGGGACGTATPESPKTP